MDDDRMNCAGRLDNDIELFRRRAAGDYSFSPREGMASCGTKENMWFFGGVLPSRNNEPQETNDLFFYNGLTQRMQVVRVPATGTAPAARAAASLVAVGDKLYLFGGLSHMTGWFNDFHVFDIETQAWREPETHGTKPQPRDKLQGVAVGKKIYYFGGFGPKSDDFEEIDDDDDDDEEWDEEDDIPEAQQQDGAEFGWFNDLYEFDTETLTWSQPIQMNLGVPTPRAAHGMCAVGNILYIFGGRDTSDRQNDIHSFDTVTRKWDLELAPRGGAPLPRSFHSMTAVGKRIVIIGGRGRDNGHFADIHIFDTETKQWLQPRVKGEEMSARGQHIAEVVDGTLVVFGGTGNFNPDTMQCHDFFADTFLISTDEILRGGAAPVSM